MFARLSEYLDEELDPGVCSQLEVHLDDCPPCQAFLESLRGTLRLVQQDETPVMPEETRRRILEAYRRTKRDG